jgi:two-component system response regulator DesR
MQDVEAEQNRQRDDRRGHSPSTTRNYLSSAMSKLGVSNRYKAALKARELGWI